MPNNGIASQPAVFQTLYFKLGICLIFLGFICGYIFLFHPNSPTLLLFAAVTGGYMAINIGANDVANNVGPAVGSGAITLLGALCIAAVGEAAGAIIAGGDVVSTIKKGIIDPSLVNNTDDYIWLMAGALFAGAIWLNFATWMGAPVSTTHSIVGGVLGAGLMAGGMDIANWGKLGTIVASWFISPACGGLIAALMLFLIKRLILFKNNKVHAAKFHVPIFIALMAWSFSVYLILKGVKKIWKAELHEAVLIGAVIAIFVFILCARTIRNQAQSMANTREGVNSLFTIPLIFAAGLLSFAHGANDVANAIGPIAAIVDAFDVGAINPKATIPLWVMVIGAIGLSVGLITFGPKLIKTVGTEITELDKSRAFCVVFAAAVTVIFASRLGLPVSSTHIALGGVFGVGFLREIMKSRYSSQLHIAINAHPEAQTEKMQNALSEINTMEIESLREQVKSSTYNAIKERNTPEYKKLKQHYKKELVKRHHLYKIVSAWVITVPISGLLGATMFYILKTINS